MHAFTSERKGLIIYLNAIEVGKDLCVIISGGVPHIGAVALSVARPSLLNPKMNSASTSVLTLTGHKDDEAVKYVAEELAARLVRNVVVTGGIHIENITKEQIDAVFVMLKELVQALINSLSID